MLNTAAQERLEKLQSNLCRWALLSTMLISPKCCFIFLFFFKLYLFYNDYETSYTTYINHACWHRCLRSDGLLVGGNRSARRKPTCLTWGRRTKAHRTKPLTLIFKEDKSPHIYFIRRIKAHTQILQGGQKPTK